MNVNSYISAFVQYGISKDLIEACDKVYIANQLLGVLELNDYQEVECGNFPLEYMLKGRVDDAVCRGICSDDVTSRDLFDTKIMGILTPPQRQVRSKFAELYQSDTKIATDWFYKFSQDTDYIRRYRIQKDMHWKTITEYGSLDISINLSKPEKDPKAIAAAKMVQQSGYPKCQLCIENEGYAGNENHPARQNHRVIPVNLSNESW